MQAIELRGEEVRGKKHRLGELAQASIHRQRTEHLQVGRLPFRTAFCVGGNRDDVVGSRHNLRLDFANEEIVLVQHGVAHRRLHFVRLYDLRHDFGLELLQLLHVCVHTRSVSPRTRSVP